jgi:hypothetical protein
VTLIFSCIPTPLAVKDISSILSARDVEAQQVERADVEHIHGRDLVKQSSEEKSGD